MVRLPSLYLLLLLAGVTFLLLSPVSSRPTSLAPTTHNWQSASMKVVRIFISAVGNGAKGSSSVATPDVEPDTVGVYDDTILLRIDQLMLEATQYGVKLDISMHNCYALGCWSEDAYYAKYQFPSGFPGCNAQRNDVHGGEDRGRGQRPVRRDGGLGQSAQRGGGDGAVGTAT